MTSSKSIEPSASSSTNRAAKTSNGAAPGLNKASAAMQMMQRNGIARPPPKVESQAPAPTSDVSDTLLAHAEKLRKFLLTGDTFDKRKELLVRLGAMGKELQGVKLDQPLVDRAIRMAERQKRE